MKKRISGILLFTILLLCLSSCGPRRQKTLPDYYGEYHFNLPFKTERNTTTVMYFNTELSFDEIRQAIIDSGYQAETYNYFEVKTMLITTEKNEHPYYFIIYDKGYRGNTQTYILRDCSYSVGSPGLHFSFLFPRHYISEETSWYSVRVSCTFEDLVAFYHSTGKDDTTIDLENKTICFFSEGKYHIGFLKPAKGNITLHYLEDEEGAYIDFTTERLD